MSALVFAQEAVTAVGEQVASHAAFPILPALVLLPLLGALAVLCVPRGRGDTVRLVAVAASTITAVASIYLLTQFETGVAGFQFEVRHTWIESLGISWHLGVDGISLFLVVLTGILWPLALLGATPDKDAKAYYAWLLFLQVGCMGVFLSLDLFLFFVFFEIVLVPMYMLIGGWGHGNKLYAANKFFLYTMFGSAFMLVGIVSLALLADAGPGGTTTFDLPLLANADLATNTARLIFCSFAIAFAIKVPMFPVHTWLPDAHTEAPTAGSVILAGVMLKLGSYGFYRLGLYLLPEAVVWAAPVFLTIGVVGIIYGAVVATMQKDLKRLVAYSSVAHMGFIVIGTFALTTEGLQGGLLQMVNHGLSTGALFLLVGMIYERRHTREIAKLKGLQKVAPVLAGVFTVVMFSSIGLPGLNGFVGEYLTLLGAFVAHRWWAVVAAAGVILAALYLLWAYQRVFHGMPDEENEGMPDLRWGELGVLLPLLGLILFLGLYPKPVLDRMEPSVQELLAHVDENVDTWAQPTSQFGSQVEPVVEEEGEGHGGDAEATTDEEAG
jgi:NADH-quinone oxidoreductase subunit M